MKKESIDCWLANHAHSRSPILVSHLVTLITSSGHLGRKRVLLDLVLLMFFISWNPSFHPHPWSQIKWPFGPLWLLELMFPLFPKALWWWNSACKNRNGVECYQGDTETQPHKTHLHSLECLFFLENHWTNSYIQSHS